MTPTNTPPPLGAALAGIPSGVRSTGPWAGRRQLFVRFAGIAETATMFTADALRNELARLTQRSVYHSIAICGGDPLGEVVDAFTGAGTFRPQAGLVRRHGRKRHGDQ